MSIYWTEIMNTDLYAEFMTAPEIMNRLREMCRVYESHTEWEINFTELNKILNFTINRVKDGAQLVRLTCQDVDKTFQN
jgi:precorrin-4 methylase